VREEEDLRATRIPVTQEGRREEDEETEVAVEVVVELREVELAPVLDDA
jgi:hypothetical protein